jgi:hypothetical protein
MGFDVVDYIINTALALELDMDSATDTDSEPDHPGARTALPSFVSPPADTPSVLEDVHAALQELRSVKTNLLVKVPRTLS